VSEPVTSVVVPAEEFGEPQPVDLGGWSVAHFQDTSQPQPAEWMIDLSRTVATQLRNNNASALVSDFVLDAHRVEGILRVDTLNDDDLIGFVFGYQGEGQYYIFHWSNNRNGQAPFARMYVGLVTSPDDPVYGTQLFENRLAWQPLTD